MSIVRRADLTDIPWLLDQLRAFADFYGSVGGFSLYPDDSEAREILTSWITSDAVFISQNDVRTGVIAGIIRPHPYNRRIQMLQEVFLWMTPEHRGSRVWMRLVDALEEHGRTNGAHLCNFSSVDGRFGQALERRGYRIREYAYSRDYVVT